LNSTAAARATSPAIQITAAAREGGVGFVSAWGN
jgi:hypothetical protein